MPLIELQLLVHLFCSFLSLLVYLFISLFIRLCICQSFCLYIHLSICLSVTYQSSSLAIHYYYSTFKSITTFFSLSPKKSLLILFLTPTFRYLSSHRSLSMLLFTLSIHNTAVHSTTSFTLSISLSPKFNSHKWYYHNHSPSPNTYY